IEARSWSHDHTRPPTPHHRLFCPGIWNDDRRRMASTNGRLARTQRTPRRDSWFCNRRPSTAARRLCLWPMGAAASGRRWRSCLHGPSLSAYRELFHRLDDVAGVLHRVPVGSSGGGKTCGVHFSLVEFVRIVQSGGGRRFFFPFFVGGGGSGGSLRGGLWGASVGGALST